MVAETAKPPVRNSPSRVVGVRFRTAGKLSYCDPGEAELVTGDKVVVETGRGPDLGWVVFAASPVVHTDGPVSLPKVLRKATQEDLDVRAELQIREAEALILAKAKVRIQGLPMKFSRARYLLDRSRLYLEYSAEEGVDFRPVLHRISEALRVRVELRQVGPRDEAKNIGGFGRCGRELCCATWLTKFETVTVRMAKEQALPISSEHLAGQCGRLKCCLRYEYEQYVAVNRLLPKIGERVMTPEGPGRVVVGHPLKETVSVIVDAPVPGDPPRTMELPMDQIERRKPGE